MSPRLRLISLAGLRSGRTSLQFKSTSLANPPPEPGSFMSLRLRRISLGSLRSGGASLQLMLSSLASLQLKEGSFV